MGTDITPSPRPTDAPRTIRGDVGSLSEWGQRPSLAGFLGRPKTDAPSGVMALITMIAAICPSKAPKEPLSSPPATSIIRVRDNLLNGPSIVLTAAPRPRPLPPTSSRNISVPACRSAALLTLLVSRQSPVREVGMPAPDTALTQFSIACHP